MVPSPFEINFSPGPIPDTQCATITILDDSQVEGDHEFEVEITDPGHEDVDTGSQSTTTVTIMDDDGGFYREVVIVVYIYVAVPRQDGMNQPCKGCSFWVLQRIVGYP